MPMLYERIFNLTHLAFPFHSKPTAIWSSLDSCSQDTEVQNARGERWLSCLQRWNSSTARPTLSVKIDKLSLSTPSTMSSCKALISFRHINCIVSLQKTGAGCWPQKLSLNIVCLKTSTRLCHKILAGVPLGERAVIRWRWALRSDPYISSAVSMKCLSFWV